MRYTGDIAADQDRAILADGFGRRFEYLRLSLTDICNFRCTYCLPDGYRKNKTAPQPLTKSEIVRLVRGFAALGLWKVRLTGGEPTLRPDFAAIAQSVAAVPGIRRVAMTTNGYGLARHAAAYRAAGIHAVTVSVDSLDPARFAAVTGHDRLDDVMAGIAACEAAQFPAVKVNAVLMRGVNDDAASLDQLVALAHTRALDVRFIEWMRTNDGPARQMAGHVPARVVLDHLVRNGWREVARDDGAGPARIFTHTKGRGRIGVIAPYGAGFCESCNRLRISSTGQLHLCLFGDGGIDMRPLLSCDSQQGALMTALRRAVACKAASHRLADGNSGATPHLASIGG